MRCHYCNEKLHKSTACINRAKREGRNLYCNRTCFGLDHRKEKTEEEKKEHKRLYDIEYRKKNEARLKVNKYEWNKKDYVANPDKYKEIRKNKYEKHLQYLSTPEYKAYKKQYDSKHRAKSKYGEFWECAIMLDQLRLEVDNRQAVFDKGTCNKRQKRQHFINY